MKEEKNRQFILRMSLPLFKLLETATEKAIAMSILSFSDNGKGKCWAGQRKIAKRAGCSPGSVSNFKKKWIKKRVFERVGKKKVIGGWSDILRLSGQWLTTSGQKQILKRSTSDHKQLKETIKLKRASFSDFLKKPRDIPSSVWQKALHKAQSRKEQSKVKVVNQILVEKIAREDFTPDPSLLNLLKKIKRCGGGDREVRLRNAYEIKLRSYSAEEVEEAKTFLREVEHEKKAS